MTSDVSEWKLTFKTVQYQYARLNLIPDQVWRLSHKMVISLFKLWNFFAGAPNFTAKLYSIVWFILFFLQFASCPISVAYFSKHDIPSLMKCLQWETRMELNKSNFSRWLFQKITRKSRERYQRSGVIQLKYIEQFAHYKNFCHFFLKVL